MKQVRKHNIRRIGGAKWRQHSFIVCAKSTHHMCILV